MSSNDSAAADPLAFRDRLREWLASSSAALEPFRTPPAELSAEVTQLRRFQRILFDAGWLSWGWSTKVAGRGGSPLLRAVVAEELAVAGYPPPFSFGIIETLAPAVVAYAPALAARFVPPLLSGDEVWCQGFSEPEAGSDLSSLRTRAIQDGDSFVISGQKIWTSFAQFADRCLLLARTDTQVRPHRGITAFLLDMPSPGLVVRPLQTMTGAQEFCELHLDRVVVPADRIIGTLDSGWDVVRYILASERGAIGLQRQAWMQYRLSELIQTAGDRADPGAIGRVYAALAGLRLCTRRTLNRLAAGEFPGPETSVDKLMISATEQSLFNLAFDTLRTAIAFGDAAADRQWRSDFLYSRAATIYGGTSEIQRDIVAQRLLAMPRVGTI